MKLNSPLPQPLAKECSKAAKIFKSFVDGSNNGLDGVIPRSVLNNARGFAIFTVFKAGFLFSARAGSGVVIARLDDGRWSSPSAIGTAGLGVGGQAGAEMTDFLIILNTRSAIQTFMAAGSLTLGGNLSIALGPLGRNGEALGSLNTSGKVAAMYSYSKTRGLFGGISVEGSIIVERQDANQQAYHSPVTARMLLGGIVEPPEWASSLIQTLESCSTGMPGGRKWIQDEYAQGAYAFGGMASPSTEHNPSYLRKKSKNTNLQPSGIFPPDSWGNPKNSGSYFESGVADSELNQDINKSPFESRLQSNANALLQSRSGSSYSSSTPLDTSYDNPAHITRHSRSQSVANPPHSDASRFNASANPGYGSSSVRFDKGATGRHSISEGIETLQQNGGVARAIALYDFNAIESGDLSFAKGDVITIVQMSESSDDWWTGKCGERSGIFPANRVEVVKSWACAYRDVI
ncbi:hypothetical protein DXG01_004240 [Tephrocybe rancida]|nr:hypothetical protein DXG01_004240 [Tephrocybe rancida]